MDEMALSCLCAVHTPLIRQIVSDIKRFFQCIAFTYSISNTILIAIILVRRISFRQNPFLTI